MKVKVLHVLACCDDEYGGPGQVVAGIVALDDVAGVRSEIVTACDNPGEVAEAMCAVATVTNCRYGAVLRRSFGGCGFLSQIVRKVRGTDVVVVHEIFALPSVVAGLAALLWRRPVLLAPHGSLDPGDVHKHAVWKWRLGPVWRLLLRNAQLWCMTNREAREAITFGAASKAFVLPPPLRFDVGDPRRTRAVEKSGGGALRGRKVVFIGRFADKKGLYRLIQAFEIAAGDTDTLVLAGSGTPEWVGKVTGWVRDAARSGQISCPGWLSSQEKADLLAGADVFALVSDYENFGVAVVEAMTAGVPVLATHGVATSEVVASNKAGVITSADTAGVAAGLSRLLRTADDELAEMGRRGARGARSLYSAEDVGRRFGAVVKAALAYER